MAGWWCGGSRCRSRSAWRPCCRCTAHRCPRWRPCWRPCGPRRRRWRAAWRPWRDHCRRREFATIYIASRAYQISARGCFCQKSGRRERAHLLGQPLLHRGRHKFGHLAAEHGDLAHKGAADELVLVAGGEEHGFHLRHQAAVHARQLELVVKVGHGAQATHHGLAATLHDKVAQQAREGLDLHLWVVLDRLADHVDAFFQGEQRLLVVARSHGHDHPFEQLGGPAHHVFMAQRDGVKGSGVHGEHVLGHGWLSPVWLYRRWPGPWERMNHPCRRACRATSATRSCWRWVRVLASSALICERTVEMREPRASAKSCGVWPRISASSRSASDGLTR